MPLAWRNATVDDKQALQQFECTARVRRRGRTVYLRPWERDAEAAVRTCNPKCDESSAVLLGIDDDGLGAVVSVGLRTSPNEYLIELIAVANRHRHRGGQVADEALDRAIQWAINRTDAGDYQGLTLIAELHPKNNASREMLRRQGFFRLLIEPQRETWIFEVAALPIL